MTVRQFEKAKKRIEAAMLKQQFRTPVRSHACTLSRLHAFTLTELLVAIGILSIMFTLLFIPMTQAFDNARRGRIMAELQNAADYALEIMVRELMQATEVMPQERVHEQPHTIYGISHPRDSWLNLLDNDDSPNDNDILSRIDFVVRAVQQDQIVPLAQDDDRDGQVNEDQIDGIDNDHDNRIDEDPPEWQVITYYVRRTDPSRPFQYLDLGAQEANRRQIFRAQWQPDPSASEPNPNDPQNPQFWRANDGWILEDFSVLQASNPNALITPVPRIRRLISHNALTPPDIDVADLKFTVERRPEQNYRARKPIAVVIEMTLRKPTPGARAKVDPQTGQLLDETDVPSLFIRRRVKVVLQNVP